MVKKTIPQLQEATSVTDNAFMVVDTGSVTKKISKINLQESMKPKIRTISLTSQELLPTDDTVLFASPDAPAGMDFTLPDAADYVGKRLFLKNIGTGLCGGYPQGSSTIDGAADIDISGLNTAAILVSDGVDWFRFS